MTDPTKAEELIAFLDANIVLEGKPVGDLPWEQVAKDGVVRVLIVPQAMEEIDAKKRDGRLGPHARAFNRLIAPSVISGMPVILRGASPRVELEMGMSSRIPWQDYDELDPDDGDSRIVAEALNIRNITSTRRVLISHDIKPLAYARGRDLAVYQASDDWLRGPEPSPKDKEIQRLKQQLAELRKDEPTFEIAIKVSDTQPPTVYRVAGLDAEKSDNLRMAIERRNPKTQNGRNDTYGLSLGIERDRDSSYDGKYQAYINRRVPDFVANFSEKLELLFNQRLLEVSVSNTGLIRADNFVVSVAVNQGWINARAVAVLPTGPRAPTPSPDYMRSIYMGQDMVRDLIPARVGRHEFETTVRARRSEYMEVACEDFRSGQEYVFEGVVMPSSEDDPIEITVSITAKNLRGEQVKTFIMKKEVVPIDPGELVDLETLELKQGYPIQEEIRRLVQAREYDEIEWDDRSGE